MSAMLPFRWTGEAMEPLRNFARLADAEFVVGEIYRMETVEERSAKSHNHYFAAIADMWQSLPEAIVDQFPTPEHLRKRALVMTGYCTEKHMLAASKAEALRWAANIRPMDEFSVVVVRECVVVQIIPKTQRVHAMGTKDFQASKTAVLGWIEDLIGADHVGLEATR